MSLPNAILPGFTRSLWMQSGATPTPFTTSNLAVWTAQVTTIVGTVANGTGGAGQQLNVEAVPAFGQDDAVASFSIAGTRQSDKIPTQAPPTSMTITAAWNPTDPGCIQMQLDAASGLTERTYVVADAVGVNTTAYAFNARVGSFSLDGAPGAESKFTFTLHPRGNAYGQCHNA